jgi:thioredoxin-dependent peroxiredoxin
MAAKRKLAATTGSTARASERGGSSRPAKAKAGSPAQAKAGSPAKAKPGSPAKAEPRSPAKAEPRSPAKAKPGSPAKAKAAPAATAARKKSSGDVDRAGARAPLAAPMKKAAAKAAAPEAATQVIEKAPAKGKGPAVKVTATAPAAKSASGVPSKTLAAGDRAASFELPDQSGASVSSAELAGKPYVLYFYPKDDTPGCTTQACGFRDAAADFEGVGVRVIGVSPDSVSSHQRFVSKYGLPFTLLSDSSQKLAAAYGVWSLKKNYGREYMGIVRSTFLINGEGVVQKVWRSVRVNGHVPEVQAAAAELA